MIRETSSRLLSITKERTPRDNTKGTICIGRKTQLVGERNSNLFYQGNVFCSDYRGIKIEVCELRETPFMNAA